jgi:hypothetical protein
MKKESYAERRIIGHQERNIFHPIGYFLKKKKKKNCNLITA